MTTEEILELKGEAMRHLVSLLPPEQYGEDGTVVIEDEVYKPIPIKDETYFEIWFSNRETIELYEGTEVEQRQEPKALTLKVDE